LKRARAHQDVSLKIYTKIPRPNFEKSTEKVSLGILIINFQGKIFMSWEKFQNKFLLN